jgi:hypothetical protein
MKMHRCAIEMLQTGSDLLENSKVGFLDRSADLIESSETLTNFAASLDRLPH